MGLRFIREVVVSSRDVAEAAAFHQRGLGMEILEGDPSGPEVLLGVPGAPGGRLRLVAAEAQPGDEPPAVWDLGGRLLGIYSHDLHQTARAMADAGGAPRTPQTYAYGANSLSELVGRGSDGVWWTIPFAVPGQHRPSAAYDADPDRLHSELHTAVLVVDDHDAAVAVFTAAGMTPLFDGTMSGRPFDELVGMPAGASLRLTFLVGPDHESARLEVMSFTGVPTADRSADQVGMRRLVFVADDPEGTRAALLDAGGQQLEDGAVRGPVGIEIEVVEP